MNQNIRGNSIQKFIEKLEILIKHEIDVTQITKTDTIETLAKKSGVTITEKQAEELGIELSDRIGIFKMNIASAHRGKGNYKKPTQEQVQRLSELGISLEPLEKRDIIQVFIERLEMLKEQKIDITKITQKDTIQTLAEKSGVVLTEKQAKELGIKLGYKIGKAKMHIISICRERKENKRLSKDQEQKLLKLGVSLELVEKEDTIKKFIKNLKILKKQGIDVTKITQRDTIQTLAQKSGVVITEKKAKELGIELSDKIGITKTYIASAHRGKGYGKKPSEEQVQELHNLGISLEIRDTTQEFIEKLEILKELKVDVTKIALKDTIQTLAEKSGVILTEKQAEKLEIELNDKIGQTKKGIADASRGNGGYKKPTQEQEQELRKLGISLEVRDVTQEFIEKIKILKELKIDIAKITRTDTIETLAKKSGVIITEKQAEELGIELSNRIGVTKTGIAIAYRGNGNRKKPTQEQVQILSELGISLEKRKRTGKEIAGASISSIKNMEVSDKADRELKEVVKEVENKKSNQK